MDVYIFPDLGMYKAMLAAMAELERSNNKERQMSGIKIAKAKEKALLGGENQKVAQWQYSGNASIRSTAEHFGISTASVKRACLAMRLSKS